MTIQTYVGVNEDTNAGLTHLGRMVRDAWVFGILPETETCAGWDSARMVAAFCSWCRLRRSRWSAARQV